MAFINTADAQAWAESTKLPVDTLDVNLETQVSADVLARLSGSFNTSSWLDASSTPVLIRRVISMRYVSWFIQRTMAEDSDLSAYAILLMEQSDLLLNDIISGTIIVPEIPSTGNTGLDKPAFYPTDASSAQEPTHYDMSLGGPRFSLGKMF